jgi:hypothetical protein
MRIEDYSFGRIRIDGRDYTRDVIVRPGQVKTDWWRRDGHRLAAADLDGVLAEPPRVLVIGTGYFGRMTVPPETHQALRERGIEVHAARTERAVEAFNRLAAEHAGVVAALHLTC